MDDPANGIADWLVLKSRDGGLDSVLGDIAEGYGDLGKGLDATKDYLDGAPEDVRKAHEALTAYVSDLEDDGHRGEGVRSRIADKLRGAISKNKGEEVAIEKDELITLLAEREDRLLKAVDDRLDAAAEEFAKASGEEDVKAESIKVTVGEGDDAEEVSLGDAINSIETLAKALDGGLDRLGAVEEFLTGRQSASEQETDDDADKGKSAEDLRKERGKGALAAAFRSAARGEKVTLR